MSAPVISIRGLYKSFGDFSVLENVNLDIQPGEKIAIIGGSGSGKSVLLRCIELLTKPDKGQILIEGQDICQRGANVNLIRRGMGMVYQQFNLFEHMDVMDNLCLAPVKLLKMPRAEAEKKAIELLREVGLAERAHSWPKKMSGGQKQRVAIARCLMMDPRIILLDEPTSALDPTMVGEVQAAIRKLENKGITIIIVTHEMSFARKFADRVLFIADRGIYEQGTAEEIFEHPQKEKTIQFIQKMKVLTYHVASRDYDLLNLHGQIKTFGDRYGLPDSKIWQLQLCMEELVGSILAGCGDAVDIDLSLEYSENNYGLTLRAKWLGDNDPFSSGSDDELGMVILRNMATRIEPGEEDGRRTIAVLLP